MNEFHWNTTLLIVSGNIAFFLDLDKTIVVDCKLASNLPPKNRYTIHIHTFKGVAYFMNKQLRLSMAAVLATSTVLFATLPISTAEAATYKDVPTTANYYKAVMSLSEQGIITGFADGTFKPNAKITRGQIAKILTRVLNLQSSNNVQFSDVAKTHDFYDYASAVVNAGLMQKENGKFNAKRTVTRNEYALILMKAFKLQETSEELPFLDVQAKYRTAIRSVYGNGIMTGVSKTRFNGNGEVSRSHIVLTLHRALELQKENAQPNKNEKTTTFTIDTIATTSITSEDGDTYNTTPELQKLFRSTNAIVLRGAEVEAYIKDGRIIGIAKLTVNGDLIYGVNRTLDGNNGSFNFPIVMNGRNLTLANMTVPQVLVGEDATQRFTLNNVTVQNRVTVEDGLSSTFAVNVTKSRVNLVEIKRDRTTLEADKKLEKVFVSGDAYDVTLNSAVAQLQFERDGYFTLLGTATIDKVIVPKEASLYINHRGHIKTLQVNDENTTIRISTDTSIQEVIIPAKADYKDIFSYPNTLKNYVSKIHYPNGSRNLLADEVSKPSKDQLAYNKAFENVIGGYKESVSGQTISVRVNFNEILASMKTLSFDQRIYLTGTTPQITDVPLTIRRGGIEVYKGTVSISQLQSGISVQSLIGQSATLADFSSNGNMTYHFTFDTNREMKIRSTVYVGGQAKNTAEATLNAGYNDSVNTYVATALQSYTGAVENNALKTTLIFNPPNELIKDIKADQLLRLYSDVPGVEKLPLIIKKNSTLLYNGEVTVSDLKNGLMISSLPGMPQELVGDLASKGESNYTFEIATTHELQVGSTLYVNGSAKASEQKVTLNEGTNTAIQDLPLTYAVSANAVGDMFDVAFDALTIPTKIETVPVDVLLQLKDAKFSGERVKFEVVLRGKRGTVDVSASELTQGVHILQRAKFTDETKQLLLKELADGETVQLKLLTPLTGKLQVTPALNNSAVGSTTAPNEFTVNKQDNLKTPLQPATSATIEDAASIAAFNVQTAVNGIRVTTKFAANPTTSRHAESFLNAKLTATNGLNATTPTAWRTVSVYYNGTLLKDFVKVTNEQLLKGVLLSEITGQTTLPKVGDHPAKREDVWEIVAHSDDEQLLDVKVDLVAVNNEKVETLLASATNTVNYARKTELESMVSSFTFQQDNKNVTLDATFTNTANVDKSWTTTFIVTPKASVAAGTSAQVKVSRVEGQTIPYANTITLTTTKPIETSALQLTGQTATDVPAYKLLHNLEKSPSKWLFEFTAAPPALQAHFKVNDYIVKTVDVTPKQ